MKGNNGNDGGMMVMLSADFKFRVGRWALQLGVGVGVGLFPPVSVIFVMTLLVVQI